MALILRALQLMFPRGHAWLLPGDAGKLIEALSQSFERLRVLYHNAPAESIPRLCDVMSQEWSDTLGQHYYPNEPLESRRIQLDMLYTALGGQSKDYLMEQIERAYPNVFLVENSITAYTVDGDVQTERDYNRLLNLIVRITPLHLVPTYSIRIIEFLEVARCGLAICGKARTGKAE